MVNAAIEATTDVERIWQVLQTVMDPEIPVISVVELGIVREVRQGSRGLEVVLTPTYTGCPATRQIEHDIRAALDEAGFKDVELKVVLSPAWTTDWISDEGRRKLKQFGIAPPQGKAGKRALFGAPPQVACPHCGSVRTELISEFGSTPCKALMRCQDCREPFDYFKCL
jgi:ring-1,2-phenylacetyl-CoA epoxidase subunit PaaD